MRIYFVSHSNKQSYPCKQAAGAHSAVELESPTCFRQPTHRRRWDCQTYSPPALYTYPLPPAKFLVLISVRGWVNPKSIVLLEGLGLRIRSVEEFIDIIRHRSRDFQLVALCLNQLLYSVPHYIKYSLKITGHDRIDMKITSVDKSTFMLWSLGS
jgi:hypothetical protein